ncbi:hypothetical protein ABW20_dc0104978 [Dactylellina cionopaga]|nr:hypothetical protein ABW20_dc0104978 [Dactylellina cionopaga]
MSNIKLEHPMKGSMSRPLTPPLSDIEEIGDSDYKAELKRKDSDDTGNNTKVIDTENFDLEDNSITHEDPTAAVNTTDNVPKKRGRPKSADKEPSTKAKKPKPEPRKASALKKEAANNEEKKSAAGKRGKKAGSADAGFTPEQDTFIRELFTVYSKSSTKEKHAMFEKKFDTGRSGNTMRFRWYALRDGAIVLSAAEEAALRKAIETVETNKALAVLNEYVKGGPDFVKLNQGYVWKKIKEWGIQGDGQNNGKTQGKETKSGAQEED